MDSIIVFPNDQGSLVFVYPAKECGLSLQEIARKDVPAGKPFLFVPLESVPTDHTFFEAFEADFSQPAGFGIGPNAWFIEKFQAEILAIEAETTPEIAVGESVINFAERMNQWTASKESRIAQLNQMIAVQQAELEALA